MRRRTLLAAGVAGLGSLAGCSGRDGDGPGETTTGSDPARSPTGTRQPAGPGDLEVPVPSSELSRGAPRDGIPAIVDPAFGEDWSGVSLTVRSQFGGERLVEPRLADDDLVVGVARDGEARAYPLSVLNWHEVVNDHLGGPSLVTYCPLCRTGVVAVRRVDGQETTFGVSGLLWRSNLVMYDELTDSRWSQVAATAIRGPRAGDTLDLLPSTITTWGEWRDANPDTVVLRPPPDSGTVEGADAVRDYSRDPYEGYDDSERVGLGREDYDGRLHPKTVVLGVAEGDAATAYPLPAVREVGVVEDAVGGRPVVVTTDEGGSLVAYDRVVDGERLSFSAADAATLVAGGSSWRRSDGLALEGPHEGRGLERANDRTPMFWFSWADIHPDTSVYDP